MANYTPNYNLGKPEPTDPFGYNSFLPLFNDNMDKIDQIGGGGGDNANQNIAENYDDTLTYTIGDYVIYDGLLYKCIADVATAETFDPTKWTHVVVTDEMGSGGGGGSSYTSDVLFTNSGTSVPSTISLSKGMSRYDVIVFSGYRQQYQTYWSSRAYLSSEISAGKVVGLVDDAMYAWYTVTDDTTLTLAPTANIVIDKVYGVKFSRGGGGGGSSWTDIEGTLTAGNTSITLISSDITLDSTLEFFTDVFGVCPTDVSVSVGSVTLTFEERASDLGVKVRVTNTGEVLPYTFKNYLEVTSQGAYIDTGVTNTSTSYFEVDFQYTGTPTNNDGIFGAMGSGIEFVINSYGGVSYATADGTRAVFTSTNLDRHTIKVDNNGILVDGESSGATVSWSRATGYNYYVFGFNYLGSQIYKTGHAKIYSVKIYNGSSLVRDLVPAVRDADGEIGMYDRVNDTFYTNAGTGSFITD